MLSRNDLSLFCAVAVYPHLTLVACRGCGLMQALRSAAQSPSSIHRGLSLSGVPAASSHPLSSGTLKLAMTLKQRMAALDCKREERDHVYLKLRTKYVRLRLGGEGGTAGRSVAVSV